MTRDAKRAWSARLCLSLGLALSGCGTTDDGALSQVSFGTSCEAGRACAGGLDAPLAVGARQVIGVDVDVPGTSTPPLRLESFAPDLLAVEGDAVTALAPGVGALSVTGPEDLVIDFIHLWTASAERLVLARTDDRGEPLGALPPKLTLLSGDEVLLVVQATTGHQVLLGEFDTQWDGAQDVVRLLPGLKQGHHRLVARGAGTTELTVSALGLTARLSVEVLP